MQGGGERMMVEEKATEERGVDIALFAILKFYWVDFQNYTTHNKYSL